MLLLHFFTQKGRQEVRDSIELKKKKIWRNHEKYCWINHVLPVVEFISDVTVESFSPEEVDGNVF